MGKSKQLLPVGDKPLLRHVVEHVLGSPVTPIVVVLGANASEIRPCLDGLPVHIAINEGWAEGMGSSVRVGVDAVQRLAGGATGVVLALADQPGLSAGHIRRILEARALDGVSIVASRFEGKPMPPAFFAAGHFPALRELRGDAGARSLFQTHAAEVAGVELAGLYDLDTPADYADYLSRRRDP